MSNNLDAARLSSDKRREQILKVAWARFARSDAESSSIPAIAADAGVTRALVYHYFPGKSSLFEAVLRREAERLLEATALDPTLPPQQRLERSLGAYFDHFAASRGELRELYAPRATTPSIVHELVAANHEVQVRRFLAFLNQPDTPMTRLAGSAWLTFVTEAARRAMSEPTLKRATVIKLCMDAIKVVTGASKISGKQPLQQRSDKGASDEDCSTRRNGRVREKRSASGSRRRA